MENTRQLLKKVRSQFTQQQVASYLEVDPRTIKRWEARQTEPPKYVASALQQMLLPFTTPKMGEGSFTFVDLFAGIGGIRLGFESAGGKCVFTSEGGVKKFV